MNKFIASRMEKFAGSFLIFIGVTGLALTMYNLISEPSTKMQTNVTLPYKEVRSIVINGDTARRVYVVQDTTGGIIWIGIGGRNQIK